MSVMGMKGKYTEDGKDDVWVRKKRGQNRDKMAQTESLSHGS